MFGWEKARRILHCLWRIMGTTTKTVTGRQSYHQIPGVSREKLIVMHASSLRRRSNLTLVSNVREAVPRSLFWASNGLNELPEVRIEFPVDLIGKSTMAFLTGPSWRVLKS